jgi:hypothetical protein
MQKKNPGCQCPFCANVQSVLRKSLVRFAEMLSPFSRKAVSVFRKVGQRFVNFGQRFWKKWSTFLEKVGSVLEKVGSVFGTSGQRFWKKWAAF